MIWYVFYRLAFESPRALKFNRGTAERAEMAARREFQNWGDGVEILYTLPGSQVCPDCRHPWYRHTPHGCEAQVVTVVVGKAKLR